MPACGHAENEPAEYAQKPDQRISGRDRIFYLRHEALSRNLWSEPRAVIRVGVLIQFIKMRAHSRLRFGRVQCLVAIPIVLRNDAGRGRCARGWLGHEFAARQPAKRYDSSD